MKFSAELAMKFKQSAKFHKIKCASDPDLQRVFNKFDELNQGHFYIFALQQMLYLVAIFCNKS